MDNHAKRRKILWFYNLNFYKLNLLTYISNPYTLKENMFSVLVSKCTKYSYLCMYMH